MAYNVISLRGFGYPNKQTRRQTIQFLPWLQVCRVPKIWVKEAWKRAKRLT